MELYYYPPTGGFRSTKVHGPCPPEGVPITRERHKELLAEQRNHKQIVPGPGGAPIAVERDTRAVDLEIYAGEAEQRLLREAMAHVVQTTPALAQKKAAIQSRKAALQANDEDPSTGWPV